MTPASLHRIQESYVALTPLIPQLTERFYARLLADHPETRRLFRRDMQVQQRHLATALALVVRNLRMLDALEHPLRELGATHAGFGVLPEHYPVVRSVMLCALAETAGELWTPELAEDWGNLLQLICRHMLAGAGAAAAARAAKASHSATVACVSR